MSEQEIIQLQAKLYQAEAKVKKAVQDVTRLRDALKKTKKFIKETSPESTLILDYIDSALKAGRP